MLWYRPKVLVLTVYWWLLSDSREIHELHLQSRGRKFSQNKSPDLDQTGTMKASVGASLLLSNEIRAKKQKLNFVFQCSDGAIPIIKSFIQSNLRLCIVIWQIIVDLLHREKIPDWFEFSLLCSPFVAMTINAHLLYSQQWRSWNVFLSCLMHRSLWEFIYRQPSMKLKKWKKKPLWSFLIKTCRWTKFKLMAWSLGEVHSTLVFHINQTLLPSAFKADTLKPELYCLSQSAFQDVFACTPRCVCVCVWSHTRDRLYLHQEA